MSKLIVILLLFPLSFVAFGQESYNNCAEAKKLCYGVTGEVNNIGANSTVCTNCEDDFNYCFDGSGGNSIWFYFETNEVGGTATVELSDVTFLNGNMLNAIILEASVPCVSSSYDTVSICYDSIPNDINFFADSLDTNSIYYVVINGVDNAEATFDITITGETVEVERYIYVDVEDPVICDGQFADIVATIEGCEGQQPIRWYVDGEFRGSTSDKLWQTDEIVTGMVVTAEVVCLENCNQDTLRSNELILTKLTFPVEAGPDFEITAGESVQLQGSSSANTVAWTPTIAISDPNISKPFVSPEETTTYYIAGTIGNCTITDYCEVVVKEALTIPNTFTPNGDGINDTWEILGIEKYPDCLIQVYSRWGQLVFQTTGYDASRRWDGTSGSGNPLASSTYYYVIELRSLEATEPIKGFVDIVR